MCSFSVSLDMLQMHDSHLLLGLKPVQIEQPGVKDSSPCSVSDIFKSCFHMVCMFGQSWKEVSAKTSLHNSFLKADQGMSIYSTAFVS